jgi:HEAT repeat protein
LEALRRLTFEDFGASAEPWRRWVKTHTSASWESLLNQFVQSRLIELPRAEPHIMNGWMDQLAEADNAAVLPFVDGLLNHPALHLGSLGPNLFSGGGGPPPVLLLLLELTDRGSTSAKQLLYHCLTTMDSSLRDHAPFAVAVFDRKTSLDWLVAQLKDRDPGSAAQAARSLVHLGDRRGIPRLIDDLSAADQAQSYLAFMTLKHYTQEDILFDPDAPLAARRDMSPPWRQWWDDHKADFTVNVRAAQIDSEVFM